MSNETTTSTYITVYTGASCLKNPGVGGYAAAVRRVSKGKTLKKRLFRGSTIYATNNRMELCAAITGLKPLQRFCNMPIVVLSDSEYLIKGMSEWLPCWITTDWKKTSGKPIKNVDLWGELQALTENLQVDWQWVSANCNDPHNKEVHDLAQRAARGLANRFPGPS